MVNMTRYLGNIPLVGKHKVEAFSCYCEICQQEKSFYWVKPYGDTIMLNVICRLFCTQRGLTIKGMQYSFHTILMLFKIKKNVEIGECEQCGTIKIRCRYCGNIANFDKWQETYRCAKCLKKSYIIADHPQPWKGLTVEIPEKWDSERFGQK